MWPKRCLVIAPVLVYVMVVTTLGMTTLLPSCGSSTSVATTVPTSTPITLVGARICTQPPSIVPELVGGLCTQLTTAQIPLGVANAQFVAQGTFSSNGVITVQSISDTATWFVNNSLLRSDGGGFFTSGQVAGCTCITAASGTVVSPPVLVGVGRSVLGCTPCPQSPP